jgi:hypothetical protein
MKIKKWWIRPDLEGSRNYKLKGEFWIGFRQGVRLAIPVMIITFLVVFLILMRKGGHI